MSIRTDSLNEVTDRDALLADLASQAKINPDDINVETIGPTWGQQISRKKRRSIRLGSYNHATAEVRIHPILNAPNIPAFFIQSVIHHEYLHHVLGPHHNRRFHQHERQFRYHRESQEWIRRNLFLLLGRPKTRPAVAAPVAEAVQASLF